MSFGIFASAITNISPVSQELCLPFPLMWNLVPGFVPAGTVKVRCLLYTVSTPSFVPRMKSKIGISTVFMTSSDGFSGSVFGACSSRYEVRDLCRHHEPPPNKSPRSNSKFCEPLLEPPPPNCEKISSNPPNHCPPAEPQNPHPIDPNESYSLRFLASPSIS